MSNIGPSEIILLLLVALLLFGAKRLPEIGRSLGSGMREFKNSVSGLTDSEPEALAAPAVLPAATVVPVAPTESVVPADPGESHSGS
jgi:sec-independent protein translocase protein TatA